MLFNWRLGTFAANMGCRRWGNDDEYICCYLEVRWVFFDVRRPFLLFLLRPGLLIFTGIQFVNIFIILKFGLICAGIYVLYFARCDANGRFYGFRGFIGLSTRSRIAGTCEEF
jgi:hypothetical protein